MTPINTDQFATQSASLLTQLHDGTLSDADFTTQYRALVNSWGVSNAALADQLATLAKNWNNSQTQLSNWLAGTTTGGTQADGVTPGGGYYPLTNANGVTVYVPSPANLIVNGGIQLGARTFTTNTDLSGTPLILGPGATLVANGCQVTLGASFNAPVQTCLITQNGGTFVFSSTPETGVIPDWWGSGSPTADSNGIRAAMASGATIVSPIDRVYQCDSSVFSGASNQILNGRGIGKTVFRLMSNPINNWFYYNTNSRFEIHNITFDGNGKMVLPTTGTGSSMVAVAPTGCYPGFQPIILLGTCRNYEISHCEFLGFWSAAILANISVRGRHNYNIINRGTPMSAPANYGIGLVGSTSPYDSNFCETNNNTVLYCDLAFNCNNSQIIGNDVSLWGFSAGLNFAASAACYNNVITGNVLHDSNTAPDRDGYYMDGIENWSFNSILSGNRCYHNIGSGISQNGFNCICSNNLCYDNGTADGGGISSGILVNFYTDSSSPVGYWGGSNSIISNNQCYDTRSGTAKTQLTGYREAYGGLTGIQLVGNNFNGNKNASTTILNNSTQINFSFAQGSWTPTGVNTTLTVNNAYYRRTNGMVYISADVTLPTTTDTTPFSIDGVALAPVGFASLTVGYCSVPITTPFRMYVSTNSGRIITDQTSGAITNATLSGARVVFSGSYPSATS